jgi:C1A family cysteine protease
LYKGIFQSQSEQYLIDCAGDSIGNCDGGFSYTANQYLGTFGSCPTSSYFNYDGKDTWSCANCFSNKTPISKTACITTSSTGYLGTSLEYWNIVANAAQYVGMSFNMYISNNIYYLSENNPYLYSCDQSDFSFGLHPMTIVGVYYNNWLLIRNSWGSSWGNKGYFWLNVGARTSCKFQGIVSFNYGW